MITISLRGRTIRVDLERTAEIYEGRWNSCQCDSCNNAAITRNRFVPREQLELLSQFGVDPQVPLLIEYSPEPNDQPHYVRLASCWDFYGEIVGADRTERLYFDKQNWLWADSSIASLRPWGGRHESSDLNGPSRIYLIASNPHPVLYRQMAGWRQTFVEHPCTECGDRWRQAGYLKKRSLIPEWMNEPQLTAVLLKRKERVYVEFCTRCGKMEYKITDKKRPFFKRNNLYKDWLASRRVHYYFYTRSLSTDDDSELNS